MEVNMKEWLKKTLANVIEELGLDKNTSCYTLITGSGTITYTHGSTTLTPGQRNSKEATMLQVDATARLAVCKDCDAGPICTIAGCSCAGLGIPTALYSKCPRGKW